MMTRRTTIQLNKEIFRFVSKELSEMKKGDSLILCDNDNNEVKIKKV